MVLGFRARQAAPLAASPSPAPPSWHALAFANALGLVGAAQRALEQQLARVSQPKPATTLLSDLRQAPPELANTSRALLLARAGECERAYDLAGALRCYSSAISGADDSWLSRAEGTEAVLRLAKCHSDIGWTIWAAKRGLPGCPAAKPQPCADLAKGRAATLYAVQLAEEALALAPSSSRCWTAVAVFSGRLALFSEEPRRRVALANRIRSCAERALQLDPGCDGAHHVLARWNLEVAKMDPIKRLLVRHLLGGDVDASVERSLAHYTRARELAPGRLVHRAELGKALLRLGRRREAVLAFREALCCEQEDVNAAMSRAHTEILLARLQRQQRRMAREERRAERQKKRKSPAGTGSAVVNK